MALTRMLQRRGTFAEWEFVKASTILQPGEIGLETDTGKFKVGNGVDTWEELFYHLDTSDLNVLYPQLSANNIYTGTQTINAASTNATALKVNGPSGTTADLQVWSVNNSEVATLSKEGNLSIDGTLNVNSKRILNVEAPIDDNDAANKIYVDNSVAGLAWKEAVHLLATSNVSLTGDTNTLVIDSHEALVQADSGIYRILLIGQTTATQNGIYSYTDNGTTYTLVRSTDADVVSELYGASVYVQEGTTYGTSSWVQSNYSAATFGDLTWVQFSGAALISAGPGLYKDGNTLGITVGSSLEIDGAEPIDKIQIHHNYPGQLSIQTVGTINEGIWEGTKIDIAHGGTGATTADGVLSNLGLTATATELNTLDGIVAPSGLETRLGGIDSSISTINSSLTGKATLASSPTFTGIVTAQNYDIAVSTLSSDTIALDFSAGTGLYYRSAVAGNITVTASNYRAGAIKTIVFTNAGSDRTLTFPTNWIFLNARPTTLLSGKTAVLTITSLGTTEGACLAGWASSA